jgi:hypothetical protein
MTICCKYHPYRGGSNAAIARKLLATFDSLPPDEQQQVAAEILRRAATAEDLPEAVLDELAAELFRSYDADEAARADR